MVLFMIQYRRGGENSGNSLQPLSCPPALAQENTIHNSFPWQQTLYAVEMYFVLLFFFASSCIVSFTPSPSFYIFFKRRTFSTFACLIYHGLVSWPLTWPFKCIDQNARLELEMQTRTVISWTRRHVQP